MFLSIKYHTLGDDNAINNGISCRIENEHKYKNITMAQSKMKKFVTGNGYGILRNVIFHFVFVAGMLLIENRIIFDKMKEPLTCIERNGIRSD